MNLRTGLLCLFACMVLIGCEPAADPMFAGRPLSLNDADRLYKAKLLELVDNQTTRAEILSVMGDPDRVSDDKKTIMFYWTMKDKDHDLITRSFIICEFGPDDVLKRHFEKNYSSPFGGPKLPEDALAEFQPPAVAK